MHYSDDIKDLIGYDDLQDSPGLLFHSDEERAPRCPSTSATGLSIRCINDFKLVKSR